MGGNVDEGWAWRQFTDEEGEFRQLMSAAEDTQVREAKPLVRPKMPSKREWEEHVITHLLIIVRMIGLKQAKGLRLADHCFVQHDHHRLHLQHTPPRIPGLAFSEIGWMRQLNIFRSKTETLFTGLNLLQ